jgi:hypothetical protein
MDNVNIVRQEVELLWIVRQKNDQPSFENAHRRVKQKNCPEWADFLSFLFI